MLNRIRSKMNYLILRDINLIIQVQKIIIKLIQCKLRKLLKKILIKTKNINDLIFYSKNMKYYSLRYLHNFLDITILYNET